MSRNWKQKDEIHKTLNFTRIATILMLYKLLLFIEKMIYNKFFSFINI